jgi:hypothetical protein
MSKTNHLGALAAAVGVLLAVGLLRLILLAVEAEPAEGIGTLAVDTIEAHYSGLDRLRPCACMNGTVFIGHLVVDEDGEEVPSSTGGVSFTENKEVESPDAPSRVVRALSCYSVFDEAVGEEVERLEVVPCRRCAERS